VLIARMNLFIVYMRSMVWSLPVTSYHGKDDYPVADRTLKATTQFLVATVEAETRDVMCDHFQT
jgi:hypothetical protein